MRWRVGSFKPQNQELVEAGCSTLKKSGDGICGFLGWMFIFFPVGRKGSVSLVRRILRSEINAHNPNANRMAALSFEFLSLPYEIADYAIDLLDHRLGQYFGFSPDFDVCDWSSRHRESLIC